MPRDSTPINVSDAGDNTLIEAVAGQPIIVLGYRLTVADAVEVVFKSAATELEPLILGTGISSAHAEQGLFATQPGEALVLNLSDAIAVKGGLTYRVGNY